MSTTILDARGRLAAAVLLAVLSWMMPDRRVAGGEPQSATSPSATSPSATSQSARSGQVGRAAWTTSRIVGSPEPPSPYITERAFPKLKFDRCLELVSLPGSERLLVVEQSGKIFSFPNRAEVARPDLVIDMAEAIPGLKQVYALALHPDFLNNRFCYVCYILAPELEEGTHVARFRLSDSDPPTIDASSETTILTWLSGGHNGCCLKFGPDGFLYISTGDGVGPNPPDTRRTGQDISDLLSSVLRIDVDRTEGPRNYRIPADNPFVGQPGARGEVWAYGLRNPWRMSFDQQGNLWVGDVGWELWEMLYRVERGGNYGWSVTEGRQPTNPEWPRGPTPILPPTIEHPHSESSSITDGLTYYGSRLEELRGMHVYGDYDTGKIWGFRYDRGQVVGHLELADTAHRIVSFGADHDGELLLLDHTAGTLHRLVPNPRRGQPSEFPRLLSESGLFESLRPERAAAGVVAYEINASPWADHAEARRYVAVPGQLSVASQGAKWTFAEGSVLVKTLSLEMERGRPETARRVETQLLHFDGVEWQPYSYRWNEAQTDAELVDAGGAEATWEIRDPEAPGGVRRQVWRFAGRAECQRCHNSWSGPVLGFNPPQLNRSAGPGQRVGGGSQLEYFTGLGLLSHRPDPETTPKLADPRDQTAAIAARARAYLHVNCGHCHRLHAGGAVLSKMHFDLPLEKTDMVGAAPSQGSFGIPSARVLAPGLPHRSVLWYRMAKLGGGRMPHIGSTEVDREGLLLMHRWIRELPEPDGEQRAHSASRQEAEWAEALRQFRDAESAPAMQQPLERLLASTAGALLVLHALDAGQLEASQVQAAIHQGAQHSDVRVRELFERFLPPDQRVRRLGSVVRPEQILALQGDSDRGQQLLLATDSVQCKSCHRIGQQGQALGPDLTAIGKKYRPEQLLESILEPSKFVDPKYVTYMLETVNGELVSGLLVSRDDSQVVLRDARNQLQKFSADQIERLVPQRQSLMPQLLLRDLSAQQVADLLAYLSQLRE